MLSECLTARGESGAVYRFINPLGSGRGMKSPKVWKAVRDSDGGAEFVAKAPSRDDDGSLNWPAFQHEANMQRLFADEPMLRRMVDFIPKAEGTKPIMILEPFQTTLWDARTTRPFSTKEILTRHTNGQKP
jgi:male germ cell-associated kinase